MKLALDRYAYLNSPIHQWQQTYKFVGLLGLIFAFAFVQKIILLPVILVISVIIYGLAKLPFTFLISRLRYPGWFILSVVILLPFLAGDTVIWQLGWLAIKQEGLKATFLVSVRFFCILTVSLVLFGTAPFLTSIRAIRSLGLPPIMVDMTLLAYRYLEQLGDMLVTMQRAIKLKGFDNKKLNYRNLKILSQLTGSLLIRSYEQSQRVYQAMVLRGYGYQNKPKNSGVTIKNITRDRYSFTAMMICLALSLLLVLAEVVLSISY
ncbi:cobalt ABC transporter, inner membrane subunit CbiQ [Stanieria sp. NIES-3757]|nr:cobalt ABC transporter, inner membrane subunit CbiQ [Stanieria sp. NIES-3757]